MQQPTNLKRLVVAASVLALFGSGVAHAQSASQSGSASQPSSTSQIETSGTSTTTGAGSTAAAKGNGAALSKNDQDLVREMAQANLAEIETGKVALSKSNNDQVKVFAQRMIDDHTLAQKDLEQLAQSKGLTLPAEPDRKHRNAVEKLSALQGDKFDKAYLSQGNKDHRDTHKLLERAQKNAKDADLKTLASKTLPVITQHQTMAQTVRAEHGKSTQATGSSDSSTKASGASSGTSVDSQGGSGAGTGK